MKRGAWLVTLILTACSSGPPRSTAQSRPDPNLAAQPRPPRAFVDQLIGALEQEDPAAWWRLLSKPMQGRLGSPAAAHDQLAAWRRDVLPLAPMLRGAEIDVDPSAAQKLITYAVDGAPPVALARVVLEDDVLRLDE